MTFTEGLTMHLDGSGFSVLHHRVHGDGRPLSITHHRRTDGSPAYRITGDVFHCEACRADFDRLATRGAGLTRWLEEHAAHAAGKEDLP